MGYESSWYPYMVVAFVDVSLEYDLVGGLVDEPSRVVFHDPVKTLAEACGEKVVRHVRGVEHILHNKVAESKCTSGDSLNCSLVTCLDRKWCGEWLDV
jgi:hypothetical protein